MLPWGQGERPRFTCELLCVLRTLMELLSSRAPAVVSTVVQLGTLLMSEYVCPLLQMSGDCGTSLGASQFWFLELWLLATRSLWGILDGLQALAGYLLHRIRELGTQWSLECHFDLPIICKWYSVCPSVWFFRLPGLFIYFFKVWRVGPSVSNHLLPSLDPGKTKDFHHTNLKYKRNPYDNVSSSNSWCQSAISNLEDIWSYVTLMSVAIKIPPGTVGDKILQHWGWFLNFSGCL